MHFLLISALRSTLGPQSILQSVIKASASRQQQQQQQQQQGLSASFSQPYQSLPNVSSSMLVDPPSNNIYANGQVKPSSRTCELEEYAKRYVGEILFNEIN